MVKAKVLRSFGAIRVGSNPTPRITTQTKKNFFQNRYGLMARIACFHKLCVFITYSGRPALVRVRFPISVVGVGGDRKEKGVGTIEIEQNIKFELKTLV